MRGGEETPPSLSGRRRRKVNSSVFLEVGVSLKDVDEGLHLPLPALHLFSSLLLRSGCSFPTETPRPFFAFFFALKSIANGEEEEEEE